MLRKRGLYECADGVGCARVGYDNLVPVAPHFHFRIAQTCNRRMLHVEVLLEWGRLSQPRGHASCPAVAEMQ